MIHLCSKCSRVLKDGDRVKVDVEATYHQLHSNVAYALDKSDLSADSETLRHVDCYDHEGD